MSEAHAAFGRRNGFGIQAVLGQPKTPRVTPVEPFPILHEQLVLSMQPLHALRHSS